MSNLPRLQSSTSESKSKTEDETHDEFSKEYSKMGQHDVFVRYLTYLCESYGGQEGIIQLIDLTNYLTLDGFVETVQGTVAGNDLGRTLTHEHCAMQFDVAFTKPPSHVYNYPTSGQEAFRLPNLATLRQYPYGLPYNIKLDDADTKAVMLDEMLRYKKLGGKTIVENTTEGISRDAQSMKKLSQQSGLNIIIGTGYYVAGSQTPSTLSLSVEAMHNLMLKELTVGVELPDAAEEKIKCGIIGEIAGSWPLHDFERNAIQAVAATQSVTNAPISFHPGRHPESPFEIIRIFQEAGGNPEDVVMSHLDRTIFKDDEFLEFAKLKTFLQFDLFGTECSYYQLQEEIDMLSDAQRILRLKFLKEAGHLNKILMSHDIHTKHRLSNFGGHGYGHILQNIVPKMKCRGFLEDELDQILIKNPKRWLTG